MVHLIPDKPPRCDRLTAGVAFGGEGYKTACGGPSKSRCSCRRLKHERQEAISRGLRLIRFRFSIPNGELPDLGLEDLDKYLLYQLSSGRPRPSLSFPRIQTSWTGTFPQLLRMGRRDRWAFACSVAALKRGLRNDNCKVHRSNSWDKWSSNALRVDPPASDPEYLRFVRKETARIFYPGWDRTYDSFCLSFVPKASARFERFSNASAWWAEQTDWEHWQQWLRGRECPIRQGWKIRYKEIPAVGKMRPMGIPTVDWDLLGPLHKTMYQFISSQDWCLRGSPTERRIRRVCRHEWNTSVDLVSATDNLPLDVASAILETLLSRATHVPGLTKVMACDSLRPYCRGSQVTHGQSMGTYLSFPLLCVQSYLAARWSTRSIHEKDKSFLVNGDDCLISTIRPVLASDYPPGFVLNERKTMRQRNAAEINSTVFIRQGRRWFEVKGLRRGASYPDPAGLVHTAAVAVGAGPRWQSALVRSGLVKRMLPSQLGMDLGIREVYMEEWRRTHSQYYVRPTPPKIEGRFLISDIEPTYGDRYGFHKDLFEGGRDGSDWTIPDSWADLEKFVYRPRFPKNRRLSRVPFKKFLKLRRIEGKRPEVFFYSQRFDSVSSGDVRLDYDLEEGWISFFDRRLGF